MVRILISISLVIIQLVALVRPMAPLLDYAMRYDYITNELCENKDDLQMQCNGMCHLSKELDRATEKEADPMAPIPVQPTIEEYSAELAEMFRLDLFDQSFANISLNAAGFLPSGVSLDIFHPPEI